MPGSTGGQPIATCVVPLTGGSSQVACTFSTTQPSIIVANSFSAGQAVQFAVGAGGILPTGLSLATTYYVISTNLTTAHCEVSLTSGGSAVSISTTGTAPCFIQSGFPIVLPFNLSKAFTVSRTWENIGNEYHDGSFQVNSLVTSSRRTWTIKQRLTPTVLATLYAFWLANPNQCFYFYDPFEPTVGNNIGSNWNTNGAPAAGRYTVYFQGQWNQTSMIPRTEADFVLVEAA